MPPYGSQTVANMPPGGIPLLVVGTNNTTVNLAPLGAPACDLHVSPDVIVTALGPVALPIPNNLSLLGFQIHSQAVAFEPLPNGFAVALSDANSLTIGAR